ncbi:MAG: hypothetical protein LPH21_12915, partial [Shewanella sp.]|nr:hypothetical protein [Shewanella sp.]
EAVKGVDGVTRNLITDKQLAEYRTSLESMVATTQQIRDENDAYVSKLAGDQASVLDLQNKKATQSLAVVQAQLKVLTDSNDILRKFVEGFKTSVDTYSEIFGGSALDQLTIALDSSQVSTSEGLGALNESIRNMVSDSNQQLELVDKVSTTTMTAANEIRNFIEATRIEAVGNGEFGLFRDLQDSSKIVSEIQNKLTSGIFDNVGLTFDAESALRDVRQTFEVQTRNSAIKVDLEGKLVKLDASGVGVNLELGNLQGYKDGGHIRGAGTGRSDSILSWLSNGEYVIPAHIVNMFGKSFFDSIRSGNLPLPRFRNGGMAGAAQSIINNNGLQLAGMHRIDISGGAEELTLFADARSLHGLEQLLTKAGR